MKKPQQESGPAGWPYRLQMNRTLSTGWSATLFQGQVAIARVSGSPHGGDVQDLRFDQPEREASFLTWLNGVRLPLGVERRPEAVVHFMMERALTSGTVDHGGQPDAAQQTDAIMELFGLFPGSDVVALESSCEALPLHVACSWAMRVCGLTEGQEVELFGTYADTVFELAHLGRLMMSGEPARFELESSKATVSHVVTLLAALGSRFRHTASGRMRKSEQERLSEMVDDLFGLSPTVFDFMIGDDGCQHEVLLQAICLHAPRTGVSFRSGGREQEDLLVLIAALVRALTVICGLDVNAVLSALLSRGKAQTGTKRRVVTGM